MAKSIYCEKAVQPDEAMITFVIGENKEKWDTIINHVSKAYTIFTQEWKFYGKAWGWFLVLKSKTKTLCYLVPMEGYFQVSIIFNDKGRALAVNAELPEGVLQAVEDSKNNPKNIPYDFDVKTKDDVAIAKKLIEVRSKT